MAKKDLNWKKLHFGKVERDEVKNYVSQLGWQRVRIEMKGKDLETKWKMLNDWLNKKNKSRSSQVQVTNYVTALSRGGLIDPSDYK